MCLNHYTLRFKNRHSLKFYNNYNNYNNVNILLLEVAQSNLVLATWTPSEETNLGLLLTRLGVP